MKRKDLGKPLFRRDYGYGYGDGKTLTLQVWRPSRHDGHLLCWYRIKGLTGLHQAPGMDELGAFYNALLIAGLSLHSFREKEPSLEWSGAIYKEELGLPHPYKVPFDERSGEWAVQPLARGEVPDTNQL